MPDEPEKSGQEPNLELPSLLGFGRRKKKSKSDTVADKPAGDEVVAEESVATETASESTVEADDPRAADPVPQPRAGLAPATDRPKRPPPVPPPPATRPEPEVREPEVAPEPDITPEPEIEPEPEVVPEPEVRQEPQVAPEPEVRQDSEDTEVIENAPPEEPVAAPAAEPENEQPPAVAAAAPAAARSDAPVHEGQVGWADEERDEVPVYEPAGEPVGQPANEPVAAGARRARPPRRQLPVINPLLAVGLTGGVVGLVGVALTSVAGRGCEVIRGVGSCGGIGLLALLVILVLEVLLGAVLLKAWRISDPTSTSFLGVGLAAVFVLLFLLSSLESVWMFVVIPVLSVLTFVLSWWVTESFVESSSVDDLHR